MKALFTAIRNKEIEKIQTIISKNPQLVNATAKQPPKKDDGQSALQVAFKSRNFWAAKFFLENDADVNFMEKETVNEWRMPVIQDAIMATISLVRFAVPVNPWDPEKKGQNEIRNTKDNFEKIFALLSMMIEKGADVSVTDSYGNHGLMRACLDVANFWTIKPEPLNKEAVEDIRRVFDLLITAGADLNQTTPTRGAVSESYPDILAQIQRS
jgi:ankyrin repeat protein